MNSIKPVKEEHLAAAIGLVADGAGLPSRGSIAQAIRSFVDVHRVAKLDDLEEWFFSLVLAAGYTDKLWEKRLHSVCSQLLAIGDFAAVRRNDVTFLICVEPQIVNVGLDLDVILGDAPQTAVNRSGQDIARRIGRQRNSINLFNYLPSPPWGTIAVSLGLSRGTSPSQLLTSICASGGGMERNHESVREYKCKVSLHKSGLSLCRAAFEDETVPLVCFPNKQGMEQCIRLDADEHLSWLYLSGLGINATRDWPEDLPLPASLLAALTLIGEPQNDDLLSWSIPDKAQKILADWLSLPILEQVPSTSNLAQEKIIYSPASARLLVAAGPGSGKTWTGCMRVSKLIEAGISPSRILIISFTRAAVQEIRARIASFLEDPNDAYQLNIQTLDSFAWTLNVGEGNGHLTSGSFDESISTALQLLDDPEDWLLDAIDRYQHVLIDEAQDLTGDRKMLVVSMLRNLAEKCGITIFHDPAQAIYGFLDEDSKDVEEELGTLDPPFGKIALDRNYRCKSQRLEAMFADGRSMLSNTSSNAKEIYCHVRKRIEEVASPANARRSGIVERSTFYLYRSRGQLNSAIDQALKNGNPFRTRLPQHRNLAQPWIAATLQSVIGRTISKSDFVELFNELRPHPGFPADRAWQELSRVCRSQGQEIDLKELAEFMVGGSKSPELAISDIGPRWAPLYSTIHAAKGREAETVVLSLPFEPKNKTEKELLEEAKVLYVAATRASTEVRLTSSPRGMKTLNTPSKRTWLQWSRSTSLVAKVEMGCLGDVEPTWQSLASQSKADANFILWQASQRAERVLLKLTDGSYRIFMDNGDIEVGNLSSQFNADLRIIAGEFTQEEVHPARTIADAFMLGASSRATLDEHGMPSFTLVPILSGTPLVFFNRS